MVRRTPARRVGRDPAPWGEPYEAWRVIHLPVTPWAAWLLLTTVLPVYGAHFLPSHYTRIFR